MKKIIKKEISCCDACGKEDVYVTACLYCGTEHCFECRQNSGKVYRHSVFFGGSDDGYYCNKCDNRLTKSNADGKHVAYQSIVSLQREHEAWNQNFKRRCDSAESTLRERLIGR